MNNSHYYKTVFDPFEDYDRTFGRFLKIISPLLPTLETSTDEKKDEIINKIAARMKFPPLQMLRSCVKTSINDSNRDIIEVVLSYLSHTIQDIDVIYETQSIFTISYQKNVIMIDELMTKFRFDPLFQHHSDFIFQAIRSGSSQLPLLKKCSEYFPLNRLRTLNKKSPLRVAVEATGYEENTTLSFTRDPMIEFLIQQPDAFLHHLPKKFVDLCLNSPGGELGRLMRKLRTAEDCKLLDELGIKPIPNHVIKSMCGSDRCYALKIKLESESEMSEETSTPTTPDSNESPYASALRAAMRRNSIRVIKELLHYLYWEAQEAFNISEQSVLQTELVDWIIANSVSVHHLLPDEYFSNNHLEPLFRELFPKSLATKEATSARFLYDYQMNAALNDKHNKVSFDLSCFYLKCIVESGREDVLE